MASDADAPTPAYDFISLEGFKASKRGSEGVLLGHGHAFLTSNNPLIGRDMAQFRPDDNGFRDTRLYSHDVLPPAVHGGLAHASGAHHILDQRHYLDTVPP